MEAAQKEKPAAAASPDAIRMAHTRGVVSFYGHLHPEYHQLLRGNGLPPAMHLGFWDERTRSHAKAQTNMNRALAKRAGIRSGDRVLDAGCGAGHSSIWLAGEFGVRVVGINLVPGQIYTARRTAYLLGLSHRVTFERQDFTHTSFPEGSFDAVWALESICHTQEKQGFLTEARRLLKLGGRLVVADLFRTQRPFAADEEELLQSWLSGWAVPDLATTGEFAEAACGVGFTDVTVEDATADVWPSLLRIYRLGLVGYPVASLLKALRLCDTDHLADAARACNSTARCGTTCGSTASSPPERKRSSRPGRFASKCKSLQADLVSHPDFSPVSDVNFLTSLRCQLRARESLKPKT